MRYIRLAAEFIGYFTVLIALIVAVSLYLTSDNRAAQSAGYENAADQRAAQKAGVTDPTEWRKQQAENKERIAAEFQRSEAAAAAERRETEERKKAEAAAAASREKEAEAKKAADCRQDLRCWAEKGTATASVYCKEKIEKLAEYSMKWTDSWYETKFSHFRWSKSAPKEMGVVTYVGDKAQFQNGFGAFQNVIYTCDLIPNDSTHTIFDVSAKAGRLD